METGEVHHGYQDALVVSGLAQPIVRADRVMDRGGFPLNMDCSDLRCLRKM